ncbi:MAG: hypothetical protein WCJ18_04865, partial [Planctomycetota bacterium]
WICVKVPRQLASTSPAPGGSFLGALTRVTGPEGRVSTCGRMSAEQITARCRGFPCRDLRSRDRRKLEEHLEFSLR